MKTETLRAVEDYSRLLKNLIINIGADLVMQGEDISHITDFIPQKTLSVCMIVKNEESNIERALSWGKGIVSEQIVIDTGSTDNTVKIAESMGAKVYHFEWIDDFSAAKNYAIEKCSGDWIAFLDAALSIWN